MVKKVLLGLIAIIVLIQFIPVDRSNPIVTQNVVAPEPVKQVLKNSCYNCHSNETVWPWYSYIAPVSWLVAHDVEEARAHINFSQWDSYNAKKQARIIEEILEEVDIGEMPLPIYLLLHPGAKPQEEDILFLTQWYFSTNAGPDEHAEGEEHEQERTEDS